MRFTAEDYVDDVLNGRIPTCRFVRLACERHRRDLETGHERGIWFDQAAAMFAVTFFHTLTLWEGEKAGQRMMLQPPQQFWIWSLFGWKRDDGTRRFRTGYLEVGRKNGKTPLAAGIGLMLAFFDGEAGAQVYSAATKREQALICHNHATQMVKKSPRIGEQVKVFRQNLHSLATASKFEPLSSDYNKLDGLNSHCVIADELHAWPDRELWGVLKTSQSSRTQPLMFAITTAGVDLQSVCFVQREYGTKILQGIIEDDSFWVMIYTLDMKTDWPDLEQDDDWEDEANWIKANPMLGVIKKWDTMRSAAREARSKPSELNGFLRWDLNVWTQAETRWVNPIQWQACGRHKVVVAELAGRRCYGGLDLSSTLDISAWVMVFPPLPDETLWFVLCRFWLPAQNMMDRVSRDRVPYDVWSRQGWITLTPGNVIDYAFIEAAIESDMDTYDVAEVAYDPWNATSTSNNLAEKGAEMVEFRQGFVSMNPAMKSLEVAIASNELAHGNNPVLTWMSNNLVVRMDPAGNIKPDKERSREKIDGMVALTMSHHRARVNAGQRHTSIYEERGLAWA